MDINKRIELSNGTSIPQFGFGVWQAKDGEETVQAVLWALEAGYRHIDTAVIYRNEKSVGKAIRESGIKREDIFVTTKIWNGDIRAGKGRDAIKKSLDNLDIGYVDLMLLHWAVPGYEKAWLDMEEAYGSGELKAIGLSNFKRHHIEDILAAGDITPMADQMEFHPLMQDNGLLEYCRGKNIVFEAWSPLANGKLVNDKKAADIGAKYGKTGPQAILRWILQKGIVVFPKSVHKERIIENADIFDFELSDADMAAFDGMNKNKRTGADPDHVTF